MVDGKVTWMRSSQHKNDLAVPTNSAIGPSPAQRRAATSKNPTTCTLPSDVISHNLIQQLDTVCKRGNLDKKSKKANNTRGCKK